MKYFTLFLVILSLDSHADDIGTCAFHKHKEVAFTHIKAKDKFDVSIKGATCRNSKLVLKLISENGQLLHSHEVRFDKWHWPENELKGKVLAYADELFNEAISDTNKLTTEFRCELERPNCEPFERNLIPMREYLLLKQSAMPMISHETYYEGWASWVFDDKTKTMIKVYEGGM